ncbi:MAG: SH3 domain-containing protein [Candidatus Promineifilaceae bacterium]
MSNFAPRTDPHILVSRARCPHFGSADDPETSTLYPSPIGHCYRAVPHEAVDLEHQARCCLTAEHAACPAKALAAPGRLPKELRRKDSYRREFEPEGGDWGRRLGTLLLLGLLAGLIFLFVRGVSQTPTDDVGIAAASASATFTPTATATPTATTTARPALSPTPNPGRTATATLVVTFTPAPTATAISPPSLTPTATSGERTMTIFTAAAGVNIHTGPHLSYPIAWQMGEAGSELIITGQTEAGDWLQVCCNNGLGGWVALENILAEEFVDITTIPLPQPRVAIQAVRVNIRTGPDVIYPVLIVAEQGTEYEIVARYGTGLWWQVCCVEGRKGWVIGESVAIYGDTTSIPQATNIPPTPTFTATPILVPPPTTEATPS